ncbi:hypothetical protein V8C35DRAFT_331234 [Trichoderma chlorosporum]
MSEMEIERLHFTRPYMRSFDLEITAIVDAEVDIGWISNVTVSLVHRRCLIGEMALRDMHIIPNEENEAKIKLEGFQIQNMNKFKAFTESVMPAIKIKRQKRGQSPTMAILETSNYGHDLYITIDMSDMPRASILKPTITLSNRVVRIDFMTSSSNPVDLSFGSCRFVLKKDKTVLAFLDGYFEIQPDKSEFVIEGDSMAPSTEFSGTATLKGIATDENNSSWLAHAIRLFKMEVDLDKIYIVNNSGNREGDGGEGIREGEGGNGGNIVDDERDEAYEDEGSESESE